MSCYPSISCSSISVFLMVEFPVGVELLVLVAVNELLFQYFLFYYISISYGCISSWYGVACSWSC